VLAALIFHSFTVARGIELLGKLYDLLGDIQKSYNAGREEMQAKI
jgi:hypothetical protein